MPGPNNRSVRGKTPRGDSAAIQITNEPMTGSLQLRDYPGDIVRLSCEKCGRSGQYRKQKLIERYGADTRLPDLRQEIAQCGHRGMHDACMVRYVDLVRSDTSKGPPRW
jgi:hypothetical protein